MALFLEWANNSWALVCFGVIIGAFGGLMYRASEVMNLSYICWDLQGKVENLEEELKRKNEVLPVHEHREGLRQ